MRSIRVAVCVAVLAHLRFLVHVGVPIQPRTK
jgi:hypothetical protein